MIKQSRDKPSCPVPPPYRAAQETIASVRTVASFANEGHECRRYDRALKLWYRLCNRQAVVTGLYFAVIYSFLSQLVVPTALLVYGSYLVFRGMHPEARVDPSVGHPRSLVRASAPLNITRL